MRKSLASKLPEATGWIALAALATAGLPLFLCMPVWLDVSLYDVAARNLLRGGIHYRDVFDTNPPGIVWLHVAIRSLFGWRSETIRLVDVGVVAGIIWMLVRWLRPIGMSAQIWLAVVLSAFYLSTSEWVHCQRDVWMLLPSLMALELRRRRAVRALTEQATPARHRLEAVAEGVCWGSACWIKPFVIIPAATCCAVLVIGLRRRGPGTFRGMLVDHVWVVAGGALAGAAGMFWFWSTGTWPYFREVLFDWNADYWQTSEGKPLLRLVNVILPFFPWSAVHLVAIPFAVQSVIRLLIHGPASEADVRSLATGLFGAFYLSWLAQAAFLQTPFPYVMAPAVLLGLTVAAGQLAGMRLSWVGKVALAGSLLAAMAFHPLFRWQRTALWARCLREGSTAELRDRLTLLAPEPHPTGWEELETVRDYLRSLRLSDGQLTCYNNSTHSLYLDLGLRPSTRFLHFDTVLERFPHHREEVRQALASSRQLYVVADLRKLGCKHSEEKDSPELRLPVDFPGPWRAVYPWNEELVFRTERFAVFRMVKPVEALAPKRTSDRDAID